MISAAKTNEVRPGFTLIELVVVLAIAGLVMAGAIGMMVYSSDERSLRDASTEIESMAKRARASAVLRQTPYALVFSEGLVRMMPLAMVAGEGVVPGGAETSDFPLSGGMEVAVRRWNSRGWEAVVKQVVHVWRFDPDGLCEPLGLRYSLGGSWVEDEYHPLTAAIRDTQMEIR